MSKAYHYVDAAIDQAASSNGMKYTIKRGYQVFQADSYSPIDWPDEQALYGWLRNRGLSASEAVALIEKIDLEGEAPVHLPKYSN